MRLTWKLLLPIFVAMLACRPPPVSTKQLTGQPEAGYKEPADCPSRSLPARCDEQFDFLHRCPSGEQPPSMSKIVSAGIDPRKRNPSQWMAVQLRTEATKDFLDRLHALGASQVSAYGTVVFMALPPRMVLCVAELPEVRQVEEQRAVRDL